MNPATTASSLGESPVLSSVTSALYPSSAPRSPKPVPVLTVSVRRTRKEIPAASPAIHPRLKKIPEGNGTMFDNTMIMYFPENGETHHGIGIESPFVILAGNKCNLNISGRYIRLPFHGTEGHKTLGNWYATLLNAHGNPIEHYGDLDLEMARQKFAQTGAIKQLMA